MSPILSGENCQWNLWYKEPGPRFNIKMPHYQYRKSHCGDKTILRPSHLHNGICYTGKTASLYWIGAQGIRCRNIDLGSAPIVSNASWDIFFVIPGSKLTVDETFDYTMKFPAQSPLCLRCNVHSRSFHCLSSPTARQSSTLINPFTPRQNGRHFADDIFKCMLMNEKFCILIQISLKFVPKRPIDNKSALVQVMAWRRTGDKPLPEPMLAQFTDAYMRH